MSIPPANRHKATAMTENIGRRIDAEIVPRRILSSASIRRLAVLSLTMSLALLAWMWIGGLVSYAPGAVSPNDMQNIYLSRLLCYGVASAVFQLLAIVLIARTPQPD